MKYENHTKEELIFKLNKAENYIKELEDEVYACKQKRRDNIQTSSYMQNRVNMMEEIVQSIPIGIMIVDDKRNVTEVNKALVNMSLKKAEDLLGEKGGVALRCSESGRGCGETPICNSCPLKNSVDETLRTGQPIFNLEVNASVLLDGDIRTTWIRVNMMRIFLHGDKYVVITVEDIDTEKNMARLEKDFKQNEQALIELKEYDKLKTQFFSTISHELRTPLNIILGTIQLIEKKDKFAGNSSSGLGNGKYIKIMKQNCYRLLRLINNLIDITRMDSGFMSMDFKNHNIIEIIENISLSVADYLKTHGITLIFDTEIEEKIMLCDVDKLERVLLNLLSNSTKFTKAGGKIEVNIYDGTEEIYIKIKDTGIGIPKNKINKIFDRFEQVDASLRRKQEGSGIGLAIVKSIIEAHRGTISVKSEYGLGSEFTINLPVLDDIGDTMIQDEVATSTAPKVERIHIEFSDIYS